MSDTVSACQVAVYRDRQVRGYGGGPPIGPAPGRVSKVELGSSDILQETGSGALR